MTLPILLSLLPTLLGLASWGEEPPRVQSLVVQDQMILRVPVRPMPSPRFDWVERKGPRCLPVSAIRGALLTGSDHVDFLLPQRQRMRATFDSLLATDEGHLDPAEMIERMIEIVPSDTGKFRNVCPQFVEDMLKRTQAEAWNRTI